MEGERAESQRVEVEERERIVERSAYRWVGERKYDERQENID